MQDYDKIKPGMSLAEVEKILGKGKVVSKSQIVNQQMVIKQWTNKNFSNIQVTFLDDQVNSAMQVGLK